MKLPETIDEAIGVLNGIAGLLTAKEWERAAIVYAFTRADMGRGDKVTTSRDIREPISKFAERGIIDLATQDSVRKYRKAWQGAIESGHAKHVEPGDDIELPEKDWPKTDARVGNYESRVVTYLASEEATPQFKAEVLSSLATDADVVEELRQSREQRQTLSEALTKSYYGDTPREMLPRSERTVDHDQQYQDAIVTLVRYEADRRAGRWLPNAQSEMYFHFLKQMFAGNIAEDSMQSLMDVTDTADVVSAVERLLAEAR